MNFFFRNFFLDFDAYGHLSSLEQNFNPSKEDVKRKTTLGRVKMFFLMTGGGGVGGRYPYYSVSSFYRLSPAAERYSDRHWWCCIQTPEGLFSRGPIHFPMDKNRSGEKVQGPLPLLPFSHPLPAWAGPDQNVTVPVWNFITPVSRPHSAQHHAKTADREKFSWLYAPGKSQCHDRF